MELHLTINTVVKDQGRDVVRKPTFFALLEDYGAFKDLKPAEKEVSRKILCNGYIVRISELSPKKETWEYDVSAIVYEVPNKYGFQSSIVNDVLKEIALGLSVISGDNQWPQVESENTAEPSSASSPSTQPTQGVIGTILKQTRASSLFSKIFGPKQSKEELFQQAQQEKANGNNDAYINDLTKAAKKGHAEAARLLADYYSDTLFDMENALKWTKVAADNGNMDCVNDMAYLMLTQEKYGKAKSYARKTMYMYMDSLAVMAICDYNDELNRAMKFNADLDAAKMTQAYTRLKTALEPPQNFKGKLLSPTFAPEVKAIMAQCCMIAINNGIRSTPQDKNLIYTWLQEASAQGPPSAEIILEQGRSAGFWGRTITVQNSSRGTHAGTINIPRRR